MHRQKKRIKRKRRKREKGNLKDFLVDMILRALVETLLIKLLNLHQE